MNISVCLESAGPCEVALVIFDNDRLPKPTCDWNTDFIIPGKPLSVYLEWSPLSVYLEWSVSCYLPLAVHVFHCGFSQTSQ